VIVRASSPSALQDAQAAEAARVVEDHQAVLKAPPGVNVLARNRLSRGQEPQATGHAELNAEGDVRVGGAARWSGDDGKLLAAPLDTHDRGSFEQVQLSDASRPDSVAARVAFSALAGKPAGGVAGSDENIAPVQIRLEHASTGDQRPDGAADGFDFGEFGHEKEYHDQTPGSAPRRFRKKSLSSEAHASAITPAIGSTR